MDENQRHQKFANHDDIKNIMMTLSFICCYTDMEEEYQTQVQAGERNEMLNHRSDKSTSDSEKPKNYNSIIQ